MPDDLINLFQAWRADAGPWPWFATIALVVISALMYLAPLAIDAFLALKLDDADKIRAYADVVRARGGSPKEDASRTVSKVRRLAAVPAAASVVTLVFALFPTGPPQN